MRDGYFDKEGNPITLMEWADLWENYDYKVIKRTDLPHCWISSVWVGTDYDFYDQSPNPIIFETMVFEDDSFLDLEMERYCTIEECLLGHDAMVERWKDKEIEEEE